MAINPQIASELGNRIRVRVCGILFQEETLLMINHKGLYGHDFWSLPGGGLEFGDSAGQTLKREFQEECGLTVEPGHFAFTCEVIKPPLHAIELFFRINRFEGRPMAGIDPERGKNQIISDLRFMSWDQIHQLQPYQLHPIFGLFDHPSKIRECSGHFHFT